MTGLAFVTACAFVAGTYLWVAGNALQHRGRPGATLFALFAVGMVVTTVVIAVSGTGREVNPAAIQAAMILTTLSWAAFTFEYTGRGPSMTRRSLIALLGFGVFAMVVYWVIIQRLALGAPFWLVVTATNLTILSLATFGVFLVLRAGLTADDIPTDRALVVAGIGGILVFVWVLASVLSGRLDDSDLRNSVLVGLFALIALLSVLALARYELLESEPSAGYLARDDVIDEMTEAVVVSDRRGRLIDSNRVAETVFDIDPQAMVGRPVADIVGARLEDHDRGVVSLDTQDGHREFAVRMSTISDRNDRQVGSVALLRDVTDQQTHEQQLAVLNRVLRHNLRNDLDSIRGFAEPIRDGVVSPDEAAKYGERIQTTADGIVELGATVSRAEQLLQSTRLESGPVDVADLATELAKEVSAAYPAGTVTVSPSGSDHTVQTNEEILGAVLEELVENGLKHGGGSHPSVQVDVARTQSGVAIDVRDDGPGIPENERAVLLDGEETPLRHGTGIGLWLVYWGMRRLGGTVSVSENQPRGSVVTVTVPTTKPTDEQSVTQT